MITSQQVAQKIVGLIKGIGEVEVVNDIETIDRVVEHRIDLDVMIEGSIHNVSIYVTAIDLNA